MEKSAWFTPAHRGVAIEYCSFIVCGIAEIEALQRLGDHDRGLAVGREIHVVRVGHVDRRAGLAGLRVDRREAALGGALGVVGDPEGLQVPRRHHVLGIEADLCTCR
jgi:hypothetical protein